MYRYISYFLIEVIFVECMWKVLAVMGIGAGALLVWKLMSPESMNEMKTSLENLTKDAGKKMKNMME